MACGTCRKAKLLTESVVSLEKEIGKIIGDDDRKPRSEREVKIRFTLGMVLSTLWVAVKQISIVSATILLCLAGIPLLMAGLFLYFSYILIAGMFGKQTKIDNPLYTYSKWYFRKKNND
jgi:hypothetical protein